jgi:hypothetical protein
MPAQPTVLCVRCFETAEYLKVIAGFGGLDIQGGFPLS